MNPDETIRRVEEHIRQLKKAVKNSQELLLATRELNNGSRVLLRNQRFRGLPEIRSIRLRAHQS